MNESDIINGLFEFVGGCFYLLSVKAMLRDKMVKGFSPVPTIFFTLWGVWNLYFYPANDLWWSFWGGIWIVSINTFYLFLIWKYWDAGKEPENNNIPT